MLSTKNDATLVGTEKQVQALDREIVLSLEKIDLGAHVGVARALNFVRRNNINGADKNIVWTHNISSALGEIAFCDMVGVKWNDRFDDGYDGAVLDTGVKWLVRTTAYQNGNLIIPISAHQEYNYVLVIDCVDDPKKFKVVGWVNGGLAKQAKYYNSRVNAYYVPQSDLLRFDDSMLAVLLNQYKSLNEVKDETQS